MFVPSPGEASEILFELLRSGAGGEPGQRVGTATFVRGRITVEAAEPIRLAIEDLLGRAFVDRVQADERPRGYRRSGTGAVDLLVPGMPEHFLARMRGLWLSFPDGSVVTARPASARSLGRRAPTPSRGGQGPAPAGARRATLEAAPELLRRGPLVRTSPPESGLRPADEVGPGVARTDCGWLR